MMKTTIKEQEKSIVVLFEGRLDTAASSRVEQELKPLTETTEGDVVLDCTALEYISSSGLRIFLSVLKAVKARGGHVYITGMNDMLRSVFTMTGFVKLFEYR